MQARPTKGGKELITNKKGYMNMSDDLKKELLAELNEILGLDLNTCDLWQRFDDLMLEYGFDGDPHDLLLELM